MPRSGRSRRPSASRRSRVDSAESRSAAVAHSAGRLWLTVRKSNGEAPRAALGLILYSGAEADVEARVESSKMTENGAEQNASSGAATRAAASSEEGAGWMRSID